MSLDWNKPLCTGHTPPRIATYLDQCPRSGRRRAAVKNGSDDPKQFTVWRYDEDGVTRGDRAASPNDLVNFAPSDDVRRERAPDMGVR